MRRSCRSCSCPPLAEMEAQTVQPWLEPAPNPGCSRARGGGGGDPRLNEVVALTPAEAQRLQEAARARAPADVVRVSRAPGPPRAEMEHPRRRPRGLLGCCWTALTRAVHAPDHPC